jgi:signal transduction histidine kinase
MHVQAVGTALPMPCRVEIARQVRHNCGHEHVRGQRVVRVDPVWFRQAIDNLVDNALRHTPPGGRIEVRADRQGDTLTVTVEDTGPGFDEAFIGRAFEPFTRCIRDPDSQRGSAGLGLAVVSTIAQAHGGRAWAQNRPRAVRGSP